MTSQPSLQAFTEHGEQITLRPAEQRDIDAIYLTCQDPESVKWTSLPLVYEHEKAVGFVNEYAPGWWARGDGAAWVIADAEDNYAGQLDLRVDAKDKAIADVGFITAPHARGKGYMTAALRAAVEFGFKELNLARIEWQANIGNVASRRVAEKAGFKYEGVRRLGAAQRGERHDTWVAAVIKEDFE